MPAPTCVPRTSSSVPTRGRPSPSARPANASRWSSPSRASTWCRTPSPPPRSAGGPASRSPSARRRSRARGVTRWRMETFTGPSRDRVVNDAYNANPESMAAALKTARWMAGRRAPGRGARAHGRARADLVRGARALGELVGPDRRRAADHRRARRPDRSPARRSARASCPRTSRRYDEPSRGRGRRPRVGAARRRRARRRGPGSRVSNAWRRPFDDRVDHDEVRP